MPTTPTIYDTLIIGSGLAGLTLALRLGDYQRVALVSKQALTDGASSWAQGGIAAVLDQLDSVDDHVRDTLVAGAGLCDEAATRAILQQAAGAIRWLQRLGVPFTADANHPSGLHLTREGGHAHRRIVHAADATGAAVVNTLAAQVLQHPNITVLEHCTALDLLRNEAGGCDGASVLSAEGEVQGLYAQATVLATGGAGRVYRHSTNPATATGDGIAMAWRAGCTVANMEFIQFHPTSLFHPQGDSFLISEAVRGEGGRLLRPDGSRFMPEYDPRAELAPRDIVARAIDAECKSLGVDCMYLDISHQPAAFIVEHFPTIYQRCLGYGIDITRQPIPVVPAAHYTCGGVVTDLAGRTEIAHLYAVGETGYTGLHGANRLASNSLLECLVIGMAAAEAILQEPPRAIEGNAPIPASLPLPSAPSLTQISTLTDQLRQRMVDCVGIVRTNARLAAAAEDIAHLQQQVAQLTHQQAPSRSLIELRNLTQVAQLIISAAQARQESRGLHYNVDVPNCLPYGQPTWMRGGL